MSITTNISWAGSTWSPWIGCTLRSEGCINCYAEWLDEKRFSKTLGGGTPARPIQHWGKGAPRYRTAESSWEKVRAWNRQANPYRRNIRKPNPITTVFPSLCDPFDEEVPIEWFVDFLDLIRTTPNLTWLLLTKRPELFFWRFKQAQHELLDGELKHWLHDWEEHGIAPKHVCIGTSIENQKWADIRIPQLLAIPAHRSFLSVEPMLGPINLAYTCFNGADSFGTTPRIHQVIFGGESTQGKPARPCNVEWIRDGVKQCRKARVACWVKQLGSNPTTYDPPDEFPDGTEFLGQDPKLKHKAGADMSEWPEDLRVQEAMP